ncbi:MAG: PIN domain-containing protein [Thermodesulfovibrionales bacterium]|nr:PIN domain-containing protein [Thermodesulfovibrionales bacterium]
MTGKFLVDTNILVYAYDRSEIDKQKKALDILDSLTENNAGILSAQVLSEFFVTVTKKIPSPLSASEAYASISNYMSSWTIVDINGLIVLEAVRGVQTHNFSYWDSLIWATARMNQIHIVLSEDFSHNSAVEGIQFLNPFLQKQIFD